MLIPVGAFVLPPVARGSLQQRIRQMVTEGVLAGRFQTGQKMPSSRGLAEHLQVSRLTVTLAYAELVAADYLTARGRSGYFISENAPKASELPARAARAEAADFARLSGMRFSGRGGVARPEDWERFEFPFIYGQADASLFDHQNWRLCAVRAVGRRDFAAMTSDYYERDDPLLIDHVLRQILPRRGIAAREDEVLLTLGAQNALWITATCLLGAGRRAVMENPGYPGLRAILDASGTQIVPVDVDAAGLPAAGADISWWESSTEVVTDAEGRFDVPDPGFGPADEPRTLTARRLRGGVVEKGSTEILGDAATEVIITLARIEPAELIVIVRDAAELIAGARVSILGEATTQGTTNAEGRFVASNLQPGEVSIMVETENRGMAMRRGIELAAGQHAEEIIVVGEGWTIDGSVVRAGRPVEGAQVMWSAPGSGGFGAPSITRADGSFRAGPVPLEEDEVHLMVSSADQSERRDIAVHRGDPPVVVNIAVVSLKGRVLSGDEPVVQASVVLRCPDSFGLGHGFTDASGAFAIDVPAARACDLSIDSRGDRPAMSLPVKTAAEGVQDLGDIRLVSRIVRGHAFVPEGYEFTSLLFQLFTPSGSRIDTLLVPLAADDTFELHVAPGPQMFRVEAGGEDVNLAWILGSIDHDGPLELPFAPGASLEVLATTADGQPAEAFARVVEWNGRRIEGIPLGGAGIEDGHGVITGLPAGHVVVAVSMGEGDSMVEADLAAGETTRVAVTVR